MTVNPESPYLESFNAEDYYAPWYVNYILRRSHQTGTPGYFVHPTYAQLFKSKINDKISNQGPLANGKSNARFLVLKEQFRRVIHSEGFRWHGTPERVGEWMDFTNNAPNWLVDAEIGFKTQLQHAGLWSSD